MKHMDRRPDEPDTTMLNGPGHQRNRVIVVSCHRVDTEPAVVTFTQVRYSPHVAEDLGLADIGTRQRMATGYVGALYRPLVNA